MSIVEAERLVDARVIVERLFGGAVTERWVRKHCPGVKLSPRKVMFYESKVREWLRKKEAA